MAIKINKELTIRITIETTEAKAKNKNTISTH